MAVVMALVSTPNCAPRRLAVSETLKKSYPSIVHASQPYHRDLAIEHYRLDQPDQEMVLTEKNINQAKGDTIPKSLNGFFVIFSSPSGGVCQVGIIARKIDLLPRFACQRASWSEALAVGTRSRGPS